LSYKDAKDALFEKIIAFIAPIQEKYKGIADEDIIAMLANNADRANAIASKKIADVYKKV
jgi:tryptophanyl-tRNA synthetase